MTRSQRIVYVLGPMTPLADATYAALRRHLQQTRSLRPVLSYKDLCAKIVGFAVGPRSGKLHAALGEVVIECRNKKLGAIPALAINGTTRLPGHGYFPVAHPSARTDALRKTEWSAEVDRVVRDTTKYPVALP
jgi:hypothetical protein